jgi:hypothetical protein
MTCPECGEECERDTVDIGVGEQPVGPWGCPTCHWVEPAYSEAERATRPPSRDDPDAP